MRRLFFLTSSLLVLVMAPLETIGSFSSHTISTAHVLAAVNFYMGEIADTPMGRVMQEARSTIEQSKGVINVQCSGRDDTAALAAAIGSAKGQWIVIAAGQTCAGQDLTIPNLWIEKGGLLRPLNSYTISLSEGFQAGSYQVFANALTGQGKVSFVGSHRPISLNPLWWGANTTPGTTDMTAAIQAAINATGGRGKVYLPQSTYLITDSLSIPAYSGSTPSQAPLVLAGDGPFLSNLVNKASANKPTLRITHDLVQVQKLGFWGVNGFPNDAIRISDAGRIYINDSSLFANGNGVFLERAQSVWIQNNYGSVSSGSGIIPAPSAGGWTTGPRDSFVYVDIPSGGYVNHLVVRDNMNEGYAYKVYTDRSGDGYGNSFEIDGNQFEGGASGIKLVGVANFSIKDNYLGEGQTGYSLELEDCRYGQIGPNYLHFNSYTAKNGSVKLTNVQLTQLTGSFPTVWLAGMSNGLVFSGGQVGRLIDETSDKLFGMFNVGSAIQLPEYTYQMVTGRSEWRANSTSMTTYPGARLGDRMWKKTPTAGASPGWICTTAGNTGTLVQVRGDGPHPVVLPDYYQPIAYDFRITITKGGAGGSAVYKVEYKKPGSASYTNLVSTVTTTEIPRVVDEILGATFTIKWPSATYVDGDQWTLTAVVAPAWTPMADNH